ncbi:MAG: nuclear transport factor 2 family protein, partial [Nannocystaceae bacterium]
MLSKKSSLLVVLALLQGAACERKDSAAPDDGKRPHKFGDGVEFDDLEDDHNKSAALVTEFFAKFAAGDVEAAMEFCTPDLSLRVNADEAVHEGRALVSGYLRKLPGSIALARVFVGEFGTVVAEGVRVKTSGGATGSGFVMIAELDGDRISELTMVTRTLDGRTGDLPPAP